MEIKWHGTASIELNNENGKILFDPFVPLKGSPVKVTIEDFDGIDTIFVTHGHIDHILSLPDIWKRNRDVKIYCTKTPYHTLMKKGIPKANLQLIEYGQSFFVKGFQIKAVHSKHAILPKITVKRIFSTLCNGHILNIPFITLQNRICKENDETVMYEVAEAEKTVVVMGSMNLREDVAYQSGMDMLILPYNGWEDNLSPAIKVIERLKPKKILLDHYDDTFPPITTTVDTTEIVNRYPEKMVHWGRGLEFKL